MLILSGFGVYNEFGIKYGKWFEPI